MQSRPVTRGGGYLGNSNHAQIQNTDTVTRSMLCIVLGKGLKLAHRSCYVCYASIVLVVFHFYIGVQHLHNQEIECNFAGFKI